MNMQECFKEAVERKLNCTLPNLSSGEVVGRMSKLNKTLCSSKADYKKYTHLYDMSMPTSYPTEAAIAKELGCIASCKEDNDINEHFPIIS